MTALLSAYVTAFGLGLFVAARLGALRAYAILQLAFVGAVFLTAQAVGWLAGMAAPGTVGIAGGVPLVWFLALGEEGARGAATRLAIERLASQRAVLVAALSGLLLALAERIAMTASDAYLIEGAEATAVRVSADLRAFVVHAGLSVFMLAARQQWRAPLLLVVLAASVAHAAVNLTPAPSPAAEIATHVLQATLFGLVLAWGVRWSRAPARRAG